MIKFLKEFRPHVVAYKRPIYNASFKAYAKETLYIVARRRLSEFGSKMYWNGDDWAFFPPFSSEKISYSIEEAIEKYYHPDIRANFIGFVRDFDND